MGGVGMDNPLCWQPARGMWGSMIYPEQERDGEGGYIHIRAIMYSIHNSLKYLKHTALLQSRMAPSGGETEHCNQQ